MLPLTSHASLTLTATRTDNSQGLKPPVTDSQSDNEIHVNRLDCRENININFVIEEASGDSSKGTLYLVVGDSCTDRSKEQGDCLFLDATTGGTMKRNLRTLLELESISEPDDCTPAEGSTTIWAARLPSITDRGTQDELWSTNKITLSWDMEPPGAPEGLSAAPGDGKVEVKWNVDDQADGGSTSAGLDDDVNEVRVLYMEGGSSVGDAGAADTSNTVDTAVFAECPSGGFQAGEAYINEEYDEKSTSSPRGGSLIVNGLTSGHTYKFATVALDEYNNPSDISATVCRAPGPTKTFFDNYKEAGGKGGEFCFIATAAFGSYDHPTVKVLRRFRDRFLAPMPGGRALIEAYYRVGPSLAAVIADRPMLKSAVQAGLVVFAGMTVPLSALGPLYSLLLGLALVFGIILYKRR